MAEKKLLQSKLRKASGSEKVNDTRKTDSNKKDASTLTEDLGVTMSFSFSYHLSIVSL